MVRVMVIVGGGGGGELGRHDPGAKTPQSSVNMRPERIAVLSVLSLFFVSYLNFQQQTQNVFDTFVSLWFAATARDHSVPCRTKKA